MQVKRNVFVKLKVSMTARKGRDVKNNECPWRFAVFEEEEKGQGRRRKCMKKVEDDRSAERSKQRCSKCANIPSVVAVCIDMGDLILSKSKCAKTIINTHKKKREGGEIRYGIAATPSSPPEPPAP